jgi:hypothetical protein
MAVYFPQLRAGAAMQYPLSKELRYRTVLHDADAVSEQRSADDRAARVMWTLQLRGLNDSELAAIVGLYQQVRGSHGEFVFLDPEGNLLVHSEDLSNPTWQKTAGLSVVAAATGPAISTTGWRLTAPAGQPGEVWQARTLPAQFHWLLSMYARADTATDLTLLLRSSFGQQTRTVTLGTAWKRYWFGGAWWPAGEGIDAGVRLPTGSTVEISALQLETQSAPSAFKATSDACGIFNEARFTNDELRVSSIAPECHEMTLRIEAPL